ncbi:MAG: site-2 protease family protein [Cocleimonas sp.]
MAEFKFIKLLKFRNVPIYVHWSLGIVMLFVIVASFQYSFLIISVVSILFVTLIHELGHLLLANKLGLKTVRINMYLTHASCERQLAKTDYANYLVAWGGVLAQAVVFIPCIIIFHLFIDELAGYLLISLFFLGHVSFLMALFNLLPFPSFDGGSCWKIIPLYFKDKKNRSI